jgi:chemotaxis protein histidine kinase CheA
VPDRPGDAAWEREFQRLRDGYRLKLKADLATLDAQLRAAREAGGARPRIEAARRLAHRLKGTAGTYRLDASCAALERIEELLGRLLEAAPPQRASIWAAIGQSLEGARADLA